MEYNELMYRLTLTASRATHTMYQKRAQMGKEEKEREEHRKALNHTAAGDGLPAMSTKVAMNSTAHRGHNQKSAGHGNKKKKL